MSHYKPLVAHVAFAGWMKLGEQDILKKGDVVVLFKLEGGGGNGRSTIPL